MVSSTGLSKHGQTAAQDTVELRPAFLARHVTQCRYFFRDPKEDTQLSLSIPCGGWERCSGSYRVCRQSFRFFALEYVTEGHGQFTCNGRTTELRPGVLFGYAPGSSHLISSSSTQPLTKYFLDFSGRRAKSIFRALPLDDGGATWIRQPHAIGDLFQQIVDAGQDPGPLAPRLCAALLDVLTLRIEQNAMPWEEATCRAFETYLRAAHELSSGFRSLRSAADLARRLDITPAYLARLFQRYSNTSPHKALTSVKMSEAASLLVGTSTSVAEAAAFVGFSDPYHFSRAFKSVYGTAPAFFRKHPRSLAQGIRQSPL